MAGECYSKHTPAVCLYLHRNFALTSIHFWFIRIKPNLNPYSTPNYYQLPVHVQPQPNLNSINTFFLTLISNPQTVLILMGSLLGPTAPKRSSQSQHSIFWGKWSLCGIKNKATNTPPHARPHAPARTHSRCSNSLESISPIWLPLCYFLCSYRLSLGSLNAQMHHNSLALTILPPHVSLFHTQPKSRKIAFITAAWLKGTFVNVAWSLYLLMLSVVQPTPWQSGSCSFPLLLLALLFLVSWGSTAFGVILLCPLSLLYWTPFSCRHQAIMSGYLSCFMRRDR